MREAYAVKCSWCVPSVAGILKSTLSILNLSKSFDLTVDMLVFQKHFRLQENCLKFLRKIFQRVIWRDRGCLRALQSVATRNLNNRQHF